MSAVPAPVSRPGDPGAPHRAIVNTTGAWANLRNGPGTDYRGIGEIEDKSILRYYPSTRTQNGWVWVEQGRRTGWLATFVADFEPIEDLPQQPEQAQTPYDDRIAIWHWKGDVLPDNSIDELAQRLKRTAPRVTEVFVKTSDCTEQGGANWQGTWDSSPDLALDGPERIDRWVSALGRYGMNFHAWCVARGLDPVAETNIIVQACQRPGVRSLILDVEPYEGFWSAGREGIRPFMLRIRRQLPADFHIGMSVDPRRHHYQGIWPEEWRPFVNSIHPQVYWVTFGNLPQEALQEAWEVWGDFGLPIVPVLQGNADAWEIRMAHTLATRRHGAPGLGWWRLGVIGDPQFSALNKAIGTDMSEPELTPEGNGDLALVRPNDSGFAKGAYIGGAGFQSFRGALGWPAWYRPTQGSRSAAWAHWTPALQRSGTYELAVFVPDEHASTQHANYQIYGVRGSETLVTVEVDQSRHSNQWVTLGVYAFELGESRAGSVFITDLTGEDDREIAFDALRWRELGSVVPTVPGSSTGLADGYDAPVGAAVERRGSQLWPGDWQDQGLFGQLAQRGGMPEAYQPGVTLTLQQSGRHAVYACASGVVTFVGELPEWGEIIIIRHDPLTGSGRVLTSRYSHIENAQLQIGTRVSRGEQIAGAALANNGTERHLHFDLCTTSALERQPTHWPGRNYLTMMQHYTDPQDFIAQHRPGRGLGNPGQATLSG